MLPRPTLLLLSAIISSAVSKTTTTSPSGTSSTASSKQTLKPPYRNKNLDYWDEGTICTYLNLDPITLKENTNSPTADLPDAAVLFYAQWCPNCHALAPLWDQLATLLNAGKSQSNLIMSLFDCEASTTHGKICSAVGVTAYPTMMFMSQHAEYHDSDFLSRALLGKKAAGPMGPTKLKKTVKFQGDWRYGEEIRDWIQTMGGISSWRRWVDGRKVNNKENKEDGMLPVGIPPGLASTVKSDDKKVDDAIIKEIELLKQEKDILKKSRDDLKLAASHAGLLIDLMLFDGSTNKTKKEQDIFKILASGGGWEASSKSSSSENYLLKTCATDLALDYCTRYYLQRAVDVLQNPTTKDTDKKEDGKDKEEKKTLDDVMKEPYCDIFETCVIQDFKTAECKPATCPFENSHGCRYVNACLNSAIKKEYMTALGLSETDLDGDKSTNTLPKTDPKAGKSTSGWGLG